MQELAVLKGDIIHSGIHPGVAVQQVPLWVDGNNVIFADQAVKVAPGHRPLFEKLSSLPGTGVIAANNDGSPALIWGTRRNLYRGLVQPTTEDVTRYTVAPGDDNYTGKNSDLWSFAQFGQSIFATNGVDEIQYLPDIGSSTNFVDISAVSDLPADFRTQILRGTASFIIAYNNAVGATKYGTEFRWCDEDGPLTWTPIAENKARDQVIRKLSSDIIAVVELGKNHVVYGHDQAFIAGFTGVPFYFGHDPLLSGVGAVGKNSVVSVGGFNFGFGPSGIFVVDGASYRYLDTPSIHKYIYEDNYDPARGGEVVAWADQAECIAYFSFPTKDGTGRTVGVNWNTGGWTLFDWYRRAASPGGTWKYPITVDSAGQTWIQSTTAEPFAESGVPVGMSDLMSFVSFYGNLGYGQGGYGGKWDGQG